MMMALVGLVLSGPVFAEDYVENEVLIKWKETPALPDTVSTVRVSDVTTAIDLFNQDSRVEYVEPNYKRYLAVLPNDPEYDRQWYLEQTSDQDIDAEAAWDETTGSNDIVVAVIDTGIDLNHPDLVNNIWINPGEVADNGIDDDANGYVDDVNGWDFVNADNNPSAQPSSLVFTHDYVIHGTHVAGTIGAEPNNGIGGTGVNWNVSIMPLKIFNDDGESQTSEVAEAVAYAVANGADVINMSYGGSGRSQTEQASMEDAFAAGVVLVAAAGNDATDLNTDPFYPACFDNVIGVGATDDSDVIAYFSNYGDDCVDVAAPGQEIYNTFYYDDTGTYPSLDDEYGYMSGTSMATPVVSGIAALALSIDPNLTPTEVSALIADHAEDINDSTLGAGRVNAAAVVNAVHDQLAPDPVSVTGYRSSSRSVAVANAERTKDQTPYFQWSEPSSVVDITGYYVYFGRERLDPVVYGTLQTSRHYEPTTSLHGNERTYRLRIKTLDSEGRTSDLTEFQYLVDRKIKRPTWRSLTEQNDGTVELRWYRPIGEHTQAYKVYRSETRDGQYRSLSGEITTRKYTDVTVQSGQRYYYKVRAIDDLGNESSLSKIETIKL